MIESDELSPQAWAIELHHMANAGFVEKHHAGRSNYYVNAALVRLFLEVSEVGS